jgi:hypothetical protein
MNSLITGCADAATVAINSEARATERGFKYIGYYLSEGEL